MMSTLRHQYQYISIVMFVYLCEIFEPTCSLTYPPASQSRGGSWVISP
jgi:hypothetical protein